MSYVTTQSGKFMLDGRRFRFIGFNYYPFNVQSTPKAAVRQLFDAAVAKGISVFRTWCFDAGTYPSDSAGNFRYLTYPVGTNLITNPSFETNTTGWVIASDTVRSGDTSHDGSYSIKQTADYGTYNANYVTVNVTASTNYTWTFWHKVQALAGDGSHFPPTIRVQDGVTGADFVDAGIMGAPNVWEKTQVNFNSGAHTSVRLSIANFGGQNISYFDDFNLSVQGTPSLSAREATFAQLDMVLDEARQKNIKIVLSLADNPTYNTKQTYCYWSDQIYGTSLVSAGYPYVGFFNNANCKQLYKDFILLLANRVNTINGRTYKNDDTIFAWELGNELRYDVFDSEGGTQNTSGSTNIATVTSWINTMSAYIKSLDTNHLVSFGSMSHTWQWVGGDTVSNGSGYGVDYNLFAALSSIDYVDVHMYPTQNDNVNLLEYGQRLGFPDAVSGQGFRAQIRDYIRAAKANGKPILVGEVGFIIETTASNTHYPLYPRHNAYKQIFQDFFDADGDGMLIWHATLTGGEGSYGVVLDATGGEALNVNTNDTKLVSLIAQRNYQLTSTAGRRIPVSVVKGISL